MFVVERVGRRTLLAVGGGMIVASLAGLVALVASLPEARTGGQAAGTSSVLLPVAVALLCINRVTLTCTLQPLAAAGEHVALRLSTTSTCMVVYVSKS